MAAKYQVNWLLPIDLSNVRFIHLYRRKDDGSCSGAEDCCEYTLKGDRIFSDGSLPLANTYIDTLIEYGLYRYAVVSESFAGELSVCSTSNIDYKETSKLTILNFDPRGDIIGSTNAGTLEEKTIHEFEVPTNSLINVLYLIEPKIGWVVDNITFENQDLPTNILRSLVVDRDIQIEVNYKQQLFRLELSGEDEQFIALNPHDLEFVPANTLQTITAIPDDCHDFLEWQGGPEDQALFDKNEPSTIVTMDKSYKIHAVGEARKHLVTVNKNNDIAGEVTESFEYGCGEDVRITADAHEGYRFKRWEIKGGLSNIIYPEELQTEYGEELDLKQKTLVFRVSGPVVIQAVFRRTFWLKIKPSNQWGITDPTTNVLLDEEDNFDDVVAITNPGGIFLNWRIVSGKENLISIFDITSQAKQTVYLTGEVELVAVFSEIYDLKIKVFLSPELCDGLDCNQEVFEFAEVSGAGEYNDGNNKPIISIQNIDHGYEFVAWEIEEGVGFLEDLNAVSEGPQELLIKGDTVLRAVIKLTPINLNVYPNRHTLGNTRPGKPEIVTVRDVIELSADVLNDRVVFHKWNIVQGAENILPFGSDEFLIDSPGVQKIRVTGDVEIEAMFLELHEIILDAEFYGTSKDSAGEGSLIDLHAKKTLVQINDQAKTTGLYTELDDVNIAAICSDSDNPCLFEGTKPGYFVFEGWRVEYSEGPSTFSTESDEQTITLKGDLTLVAQYYQYYKLEIFRANPDETTGEYTGDDFYRSNKEDKGQAVITARGTISSVDARQYEFDRWRILQNEGDYLIDEDTPFQTSKDVQSFNLMSDLKLRVYFLIPFTLELQSNTPGSSSISGFVEPVLNQYGDGTYRETEEVKIEAVINQELAYSFTNWTTLSGNVVWPVGADITDLIQNIKISEDTVLQANFELIYYNFNCTIRPDYTNRGNITGTTANGDYTFFYEIDIKAEANTGYVLKRFDIVANSDGEVGENDKFKSGLGEQTITLIDDFSIEPIFLEQYEVQVWITDDASTQSVNNGIGTTKGGGTYDEEDNRVSLSVNVTNEKYIFERWEIVSPPGFSGIDTDNSSLQTFDATGDMQIMAVVLRLNTLTLSVENKNAGQAKDLTRANSPYTNEEIIQITATDSEGYEFSHWEVVSGAGDILAPTSTDETGISNGDTNRERSFRIQGDVSIRAVHALKQYTLTVVTTGGGTVSGSGTYTIEDNITIEAIAEKLSGQTYDAYDFVDWSVTTGSEASIKSGWTKDSRKKEKAKIVIAGDLEITGTFEPIYYLELTLKKTAGETANIPTGKISTSVKESGKSVEKRDDFYIIRSNPSTSIFSSDKDWSFTEYVVTSGDITFDYASVTSENSITIGSSVTPGETFKVDVYVEKWLSVQVEIEPISKSIDLDTPYPAAYSISIKDANGDPTTREVTDLQDTYLYPPGSRTPSEYKIFNRKRIKVKSTDTIALTFSISNADFSKLPTHVKPRCTRNCPIKVVEGNIRHHSYFEFQVSKSGSKIVFNLKEKLFNVVLNFKKGEFKNGKLLTSTKKGKDTIRDITLAEAKSWSYEVKNSSINSLGGRDLSFAGWSVASGQAKIPAPSSVNLDDVELISEDVILDALWLSSPINLVVEIKNPHLGKTYVRRGVWSGKEVKNYQLSESSNTTITGEDVHYSLQVSAASPGVRAKVKTFTKETQNSLWVETNSRFINTGLFSRLHNVGSYSPITAWDPGNENYNYSGSGSVVYFRIATHTKVEITYEISSHSHDPLMNGSAPSVPGVWGLKGDMFKVTNYNGFIISSHDGLPAYWIYHEEKDKPKKKDRDRVNKGMYLDGNIPGEQYIGWAITYASWVETNSNNIRSTTQKALSKNQLIDAVNVVTIGSRSSSKGGGTMALCYLAKTGRKNYTSGNYSGHLIYECFKNFLSVDGLSHNSVFQGKGVTGVTAATIALFQKNQKAGLSGTKELYDEHKLLLSSTKDITIHKEEDYLARGFIKSTQMFGSSAKNLLVNKGFMSKDHKKLLSADSVFKEYPNAGWRVVQSTDGNSFLVAYDGGWLLYYDNISNKKERGYVTEYRTGVTEAGKPQSMSYMPFSLTGVTSRSGDQRFRVSFKFTQEADFSTQFPDPADLSLDKSSVKNIMYNHYPTIKKAHKNLANSDGVAIIDVIAKKKTNNPKSLQNATHYLRRVMWDMRTGITSFGNAISDNYFAQTIAIKVEQTKDTQRFNVYRYTDF